MLQGHRHMPFSCVHSLTHSSSIQSHVLGASCQRPRVTRPSRPQAGLGAGWAKPWTHGALRQSRTCGVSSGRLGRRQARNPVCSEARPDTGTTAPARPGRRQGGRPSVSTWTAPGLTGNKSVCCEMRREGNGRCKQRGSHLGGFPAPVPPAAAPARPRVPHAGLSSPRRTHIQTQG